MAKLKRKMLVKASMITQHEGKPQVVFFFFFFPLGFLFFRGQDVPCESTHSVIMILFSVCSYTFFFWFFVSFFKFFYFLEFIPCFCSCFVEMGMILFLYNIFLSGGQNKT